MRWFFSAVVAGALALGLLPAIASSGPHMQARLSHACQFRRAAWSIVQDTSLEITLATGLNPEDVQNDTNKLSEHYVRLQIKQHVPSGSETLLGALTDAWTYAYESSLDDQNYYNSLDDDTLAAYYQQQEAQDTASAWSAESNAWSDIKEICPRGH